MDFTSAGFLGFLALVALLYLALPVRWRPLLLVLASYWFYWLWSGWFAALLFGSTLSAFLGARSRSVALAAVGMLISVLVLFKALPVMGIKGLMPLGLSYYTFKLAGYLIDVHWGAIEPERKLLPFLAFASFFPQIVGGPIQRAQSFLPQVARAGVPSASLLVRGSLRILLGLFKKFAVADHLGQVVDYVYGHIGPHPGAPVLLGFYFYPLQMYADFSGLTDIAIGAAMLLGFESPENFSVPFLAPSPSEYWRRWHMTLTQWMTDYVFTPLRMSVRRLGNAGLVFSIFLTFILIGLWHGFYWTFALFGAIHALYVSTDALTQKARRRWYKRHRLLDRVTDWVGPIFTFHLIAIAVVFFRAPTLAVAADVFGHLFEGWKTLAPDYREIIQQPGNSIFALGAAVMVMAIADAVQTRLWSRPVQFHAPRWMRWSTYACTAIAVLLGVGLLMTRAADSNPFLYAIF